MGRSSLFILFPLLLLTFSSITRVAEARLTTKILFPPEDDIPDVEVTLPINITLPELEFPKLPIPDVIFVEDAKKTP